MPDYGAVATGVPQHLRRPEEGVPEHLRAPEPEDDSFESLMELGATVSEMRRPKPADPPLYALAGEYATGKRDDADTVYRALTPEKREEFLRYVQHQTQRKNRGWIAEEKGKMTPIDVVAMGYMGGVLSKGMTGESMRRGVRDVAHAAANITMSYIPTRSPLITGDLSGYRAFWLETKDKLQGGLSKKEMKELNDLNVLHAEQAAAQTGAIDFARKIRQAKEAADPLESDLLKIPEAVPLVGGSSVGQGALGLARMAPTLAGGAAASALTGGAGGFAWWSAIGASEIADDLRDAGVSRSDVKAFGSLAAPIYGGLELLQFERAAKPFAKGTIKVLRRKALAKLLPKVAGFLKRRLIDQGIQVGQEGAQSLTKLAAKWGAVQRDPSLEPINWGQEFALIGQEMKEANMTLALMMAPAHLHDAVRTGGSALRGRAIRADIKRSVMSPESLKLLGASYPGLARYMAQYEKPSRGQFTPMKRVLKNVLDLDLDFSAGERAEVSQAFSAQIAQEQAELAESRAQEAEIRRLVTEEEVPGAGEAEAEVEAPSEDVEPVPDEGEGLRLGEPDDAVVPTEEEAVEEEEAPEVSRETPPVEEEAETAPAPPEARGEWDEGTDLPGTNPTRRAVSAAADAGEGVLFFDIDDFKAVNDEHGHDVGDEVLAAVAAGFKRFFPGVVKAKQGGRWGGEEFAGRVPMTPENVEKARQFLRWVSENVTVEDQPVTISAGFAEGRVADAKGNPRLHADLAAYEAKRDGKNRLIVVDKEGNRSQTVGREGRKEYVRRADLRAVQERARRLLGEPDLLAPETRDALERAVQAVEAQRTSEGQRQAVQVAQEVVSEAEAEVAEPDAPAPEPAPPPPETLPPEPPGTGAAFVEQHNDLIQAKSNELAGYLRGAVDAEDVAQRVAIRIMETFTPERAENPERTIYNAVNSVRSALMETEGLQQELKKGEKPKKPKPRTKPQKFVGRMTEAALREQVRKIGAKLVRVSPTRVRIELRNGESFELEQVPILDIDESEWRRLEIMHNNGQQWTPGQREAIAVAGSFEVVTKDGRRYNLMRLSQMADAGTFDHELLHFAREVGMIDTQTWHGLVEEFSDPSRSLIDQEEDVAAARAAWTRRGWWQKFRDWLRDMTGLLTPGEKFFKDISTAEFWEREPFGSRAEYGGRRHEVTGLPEPAPGKRRFRISPKSDPETVYTVRAKGAEEAMEDVLRTLDTDDPKWFPENLVVQALDPPPAKPAEEREPSEYQRRVKNLMRKDGISKAEAQMIIRTAMRTEQLRESEIDKQAAVVAGAAKAALGEGEIGREREPGGDIAIGFAIHMNRKPWLLTKALFGLSKDAKRIFVDALEAGAEKFTEWMQLSSIGLQKAFINAGVKNPAYLSDALHRSLTTGDKMKAVNKVRPLTIKLPKAERISTDTFLPVGRHASLEVTGAEALSLALSFRDAGTHKQLLQPGHHGFITDKMLRQGQKHTIRLTEEDMQAIIKVVKGDKALNRLYEDICWDINNSELAGAFFGLFKKIHGIDLTRHKKYYPRHRVNEEFPMDPALAVQAFELESLEQREQFKGRKRSLAAFRVRDVFDEYMRLKHLQALYVAKHLATADAMGVIDDPRVKQAIKAGHPQGENFRNMLREHVRNYSGLLRTQRTDMGKITQGMIRNFHRGALGFKPHIVLFQPMSFLVAWAELDFKHLARGAREFIKHPRQTIREMNELSGVIRQRTGGQIHDLITAGLSENNIGSFAGLRKKSWMDLFLGGIHKADTATIGALWQSCKAEASDAGLQGKAMERRAVARLQEVINKTQPAFGDVALSQAQHLARQQPLFKLLTMFTSQRVQLLNLLDDAVLTMKNYDRWGMTRDQAMKHAGRNLLAVVASQVGVVGVKHAWIWALGLAWSLFAGSPQDPDDERGKWEFYTAFIDSMFSVAPITGDIAAVARRAIAPTKKEEEWKFFSRQIGKNPLLAAVGETITTSADTATFILKDWAILSREQRIKRAKGLVKRGMRSAGTLTGTPLAGFLQLGRPAIEGIGGRERVEKRRALMIRRLLRGAPKIQSGEGGDDYRARLAKWRQQRKEARAWLDRYWEQRGS